MNFLLIGCGVLAAGLLIAGKLLLNSYEANGALKVELAMRDAVIQQKEKDASLSQKLVELQVNLERHVSNVAQTSRAAIYAAPINLACRDDPALRAAASGVRLLRPGPGPAPTGRQPAP